jgi:hypothetical protein
MEAIRRWIGEEMEVVESDQPHQNAPNCDRQHANAKVVRSFRGRKRRLGFLRGPHGCFNGRRHRVKTIAALGAEFGSTRIRGGGNLFFASAAVAHRPFSCGLFLPARTRLASAKL